MTDTILTSSRKYPDLDLGRSTAGDKSNTSTSQIAFNAPRKLIGGLHGYAHHLPETKYSDTKPHDLSTIDNSYHTGPSSLLLQWDRI